MSYKLIPNTKTVSLKWESILNVPIKNACALIYEIDLYNIWIPFCKTSKTIKKVNKGHKIAYIMCHLPIISNREAYIRGYAIDRLDVNNTFMICSKSIDND